MKCNECGSSNVADHHGGVVACHDCGADDWARALDAARAKETHYRAALQEIATRRCLSEGPCAPHGHPQCVEGSCVTCIARAALDGEEQR